MSNDEKNDQLLYSASSTPVINIYGDVKTAILQNCVKFFSNKF